MNETPTTTFSIFNFFTPLTLFKKNIFNSISVEMWIFSFSLRKFLSEKKFFFYLDNLIKRK